jgi:hypothetical protein
MLTLTGTSKKNIKLLISLVPQEGFEPPTPSLRNENSIWISSLRFDRGVHGSTRPDVIETVLAGDTALNFREFGRVG